MELKTFESPGQEWDEFASRYTDLIFYQSVWSEVLRRGLGGQPLYFYLKEGGEVVAGLPGVLLNFKLFKVLYASIPYGNLIGKKIFFAPLMELLENDFRRRGIHQVRITESPFLESYRPGSYQSISAKCSLLELREFDREKIWEGYKKNIRRDIRKAQRSGVSIRSGASEEDVKMFYKLYLASMERNRAVAKYPSHWFQVLYEVLSKSNVCDFLLAELNQIPIAGIVLINSPTSTHYFHNGSNDEFLKFCPNELLIHFALGKAIDNGHSSFDFMGSDPLDIPLLRFKEKWGSRSVEVNTHVKDYNPFRCKIWEVGKRWASSRLGSGVLRLFRHS